MSPTCSSLPPLFLVVLLLLVGAAATSASATTQLGGGAGGKVGGRTKIKDVELNKEIQDLGRFSVEEYNKNLEAPEHLTFAKVVKAESQVVAGIKYFLTVEARDGSGARKIFDAVVVVKAWLRSKELLSFTPSSHK